MMIKKFASPRGTSDILPSDISLWQDIESRSRKIFKRYNYKELRTPIFEETQLFARSIGQMTDVVNKQMLNVAPQGNEESKDMGSAVLSLRPESTASVVRSYIENRLDKKESLTKLYYIGPMFRGERPQRGRLRQFHQIGAEAIGPDGRSPLLDAELIALCVELLKDFGCKNFTLKINSLGSPKDKEKFSKLLHEKLKPQIPKLSQDSQNRFKRNVFRILDSKERDDQKIVHNLKLNHEFLSKESKKYYAEVKSALDSLKVRYEEDICLVRGLDYYTDTVFEVSDSSLGSQDALGAGGRYNNLVSQLGGPDVDAVGFALGIERIILSLSDKYVLKIQPLDVFAIALDDRASAKQFQIVNSLRSKGLLCDMSYRSSSVKSQMRLANKSGTRFVIIMGEDELSKESVTLKDMQEGTQIDISIKGNDTSKLLKAIKS